MLQPSFWDNRETADKLVGELKYIKNIITNVNVLSNSVNSALEMIDDSDDDVRLLLEEEINELKAKIDKLEIETYLNGKYDKNAAIMEIHAGAGGTESCDWAQMLYRMYSRYAEKNGYSITLLDRQDGEEAGIKSIMFQVDGTFAYGYLKGEKGVHRLVRISPFDANKRRHTSFAAVDVIPEIDNDIEVNVKNTFNVITSVPGGNGTITPSKIDVIEGSKVKITFTPNTGYMIDKVLVNGIEKTTTGNEIEITVDEEKTVEVSYKKIPFTITVEEVTGATVDPDGTVTVSYGDNKDFTITANTGYKLVKVLVNDVEKTLDGNTLKLKNITSNMKIEVVVEKIEYKVIEGAKQTYTITEDTEARFRIDADYSLFNNKVYVDNVLVDSSNQTSKSGSTIIVLNKDYVDTLAVGEHTLKVAFTDGGEAETTFTIARKAEDNNNNEDNNENNNENNTPSKPEDKEEMKDNGSNPKTGDNIMLYVAIASMSIIGLGATTIVAKKKKMN